VDVLTVKLASGLFRTVRHEKPTGWNSATTSWRRYSLGTSLLTPCWW